MRTLRGHLAAVEDEWHIRGIPEWIDPVFTFQRTWYPDMTPPSVSFNATLAKVFGVVGGGLLGYYVWEKTHHKVYTALAGAGGFFGAPLLVAAYDHFQQPSIDATTEEGAPDGEIDPNALPPNTVTPTQVPGSPQVSKQTLIARTLLKPDVMARAVEVPLI